MSAKEKVFWIAFFLILALSWAGQSNAAELRIQHTSRVTGKVTERVVFAANCVDAAVMLRKTAVGKIRTWCNGRRV